MKRIICVLLMAALVLSGCSYNISFSSDGSSVSISKESGTITVAVKNTEGDCGTTAMTVKEGQTIDIKAEVEKGSFTLMFVEAAKTAGKDNPGFDDIRAEDAALVLNFGQSGKTAEELPAADYQVFVKSAEKTTGTITIAAAE